MIRILYTASYLRKYKKLNENLKEEVKEKVSLFQDEENHQKLKVHKLHGIENTYSFSINYKIRVVYEFADGGENKGVVNLLYVGSHDEVYE